MKLNAWILFAALVAAVAVDADEPTAQLVVAVHVRAASGQVGCALFRDAAGFPREAPTKSAAHMFCPIDEKTRTATCTFPPAAPGVAAVACFHDEDGDGKLKTGLFGIPAEGTAMSNHARGFLGPPHFDDARFTLHAPTTTLSLDVDY